MKSEDALALSSDRGIAPSATPPYFAEIASFGRARAPSPIIGKGQQKVTVEHVHVHEGGQAIVGNVEGGRDADEIGESTPCTWICKGRNAAAPKVSLDARKAPFPMGAPDHRLEGCLHGRLSRMRPRNALALPARPPDQANWIGECEPNSHRGRNLDCLLMTEGRAELASTTLAD